MARPGLKRPSRTYDLSALQDPGFPSRREEIWMNFRSATAVAALTAVTALAAAQPQPKWTLFAPQNSTITYIVDLNGTVGHTWPNAYRPGNSVYLLDNGELLRNC